jgi:hypothetical protein
VSKEAVGDFDSPEWESEWERKGALVREALGKDAFDPWRRLAAKSARGLDIFVEARYLERSGIMPVSEEGKKMRARYLESVAAPGESAE